MINYKIFKPSYIEKNKNYDNIYLVVGLMKKLKYVIKRNKKTIDSSYTNYIERENTIIFNYNKIKIIIDLDNRSFIRETNDDYLYLSKDDSYIKLKLENYKFNTDLKFFNFIVKDDIKINYQIKGDNEEVELIISF